MMPKPLTRKPCPKKVPRLDEASMDGISGSDF